MTAEPRRAIGTHRVRAVCIIIILFLDARESRQSAVDQRSVPRLRLRKEHGP